LADGKVTFLTEVELPPYCFMSEIVEWIAFGRVPQMQYHFVNETDEILDYRLDWRGMPDNFYPSFEFPWFDPLEFESLGIPMVEGYLEAAEKCVYESVSDLPRLIKEYEKKDKVYIDQENGIDSKFWKKIAADYRQKLLELGPLQALVDQTESKFRPHFDIACAKLFQLLASRQITAQAINYTRWEKLADADEYEKAARFDCVPGEAFSLSFDWTQNEILIDDVKHVALRIKTQDILDHRSLLLQSGNPITVERFGAFYLSSNVGRTIRKNKLGRRNVIDWQVLKDHLTELTLTQTFPDGKENCIYELIAYAEKELGKSPSRTAVQRNMGEELDAIYAQK